MYRETSGEDSYTAYCELKGKLPCWELERDDTRQYWKDLENLVGRVYQDVCLSVARDEVGVAA